MSELIGSPIHLVIGELLLLRDYRHRLWCAFHLRLEERMQAELGWIVALALIPVNKDLTTLTLTQEMQFSQMLLRSGHDTS